MVLALRSITTFFHEMGHAIPALLFTEGPVTVFVGSYGDISKSVKVNINRLTIFFQFNLFDWKMGMCQHEGKSLKIWQYFLIVLGGPVASLIIAIPLLVVLISGRLSDLWIGMSMVFFLAALIDFFVNIYPASNGITLYDGSVILNDGMILLSLIQKLFLPKAYFELEALFEKEEYEAVIQKGKELIEAGTDHQAILGLIMDAYTKENAYQEALDLYKKMADSGRLKSTDYYQIGHLYLHLNQYAAAKEVLDQFLYRHYNNPLGLLDRGRAYLGLAEYQDALTDFDAAIYFSGNDKSFYAYRALTKIRLNRLDEAEQDLKVAALNQKEDAFLPYCWGELYRAMDMPQLAIQNYQKAKQMGYNDHSLDYKIDTLRE